MTASTLVRFWQPVNDLSKTASGVVSTNHEIIGGWNQEDLTLGHSHHPVLIGWLGPASLIYYILFCGNSALEHHGSAMF